MNEKAAGSYKWSITFALLLSGCLLVFALDVMLGSVSIPLSSVFSYLLLGSTENTSWDIIISQFRIPKAITAMSVGAALGVSGLQMQTLFRNPLAGPFVLGISSGAGLGVAIMIFVGLQFGFFIELTGLSRNGMFIAAAGSGSLLVLVIILLTSTRVKDTVSLLIVGLMFGTIASAAVSVLQYFSQAENIQAYLFWSFGNLGGVSGSELQALVSLTGIGLIGSIALSKQLNVMLLGDRYAISLGLNLKRSRWLIILNTSVLAGAATAFCGPIAFIGLAVPHIARMLFRTTNHLLLTPLVMMLGAFFLIVFDILSQVPGSEISLPLNAITALFGGPFVIWMIMKRRTLNYS